jgi:group I intron endonuclease
MKNVIYKIRNVVNDKFYVGSTNNTKVRFKNHRRLLRKGRHHCRHLQAAWNKYGEDCFKFEIIEVVADDNALWNAENAWLTQWVGRPECYNSGRSAEAPNRGLPKEENPLTGKVRPPEVNAQVSQSLKEHYAENEHPRQGKKHTPETLAKIAANRTPPRGESHYRYGKTVSEETRKKIGDTQRGKPKAPGRTISAEGMAKIRAAAEAGHYSHWKGKQHTEESKLKMSKAIVVVYPDGASMLYNSITELRNATGLKPATINRALKAKWPISKGKFEGWEFFYADEFFGVDTPS